MAMYMQKPEGVGSPDLTGETNTLLEQLKDVQPVQEQNQVGAGGWGSLSDQQKMGIANAVSQGGKAGGIGGMLMSGGLQAGLMGAGPAGWAVAGGGLLLSQIEEAQKRKAEHEQALIQAKAQRDQNVLAQLRDLGSNSYRIS